MLDLTILPPELLLQIIEHTRPDAHRSLEWVPAHCASIASYALVCRAWTPVAQYALFRLVVLGSNPSEPFRNSLAALTGSKSPLPCAVDKLELAVSNIMDLHVLAQIVALCPNLRHFSVHAAQFDGHDLVAFAEEDIGLLSTAARVTHVTARIFVPCASIVVQLLCIWTHVAYLDVRGTAPGGFVHRTPSTLRELRVYSGYLYPITDPSIKLEALVINGVTIRLSDFTAVLPQIRRLHIVLPYDVVENSTLSLLSSMTTLQEFILTAGDLRDSMIDAIPHNILRLGLRLRLVLQRSTKLANLLRTRRLRSLTGISIFTNDQLDAYETLKIDQVRTAATEVGVQVQVLDISELWAVPTVY